MYKVDQEPLAQKFVRISCPFRRVRDEKELICLIFGSHKIRSALLDCQSSHVDGQTRAYRLWIMDRCILVHLTVLQIRHNPPLLKEQSVASAQITVNESSLTQEIKA